jgi:oligopeptidase A
MNPVSESNPMLDFSGLARFDAIRPEHVQPAIDQLLDENRSALHILEDPASPANWHEFIEPLEDVTERLSRAWKAVEHMNAVVDSPELRAAYNEALPRVTEFWASLSQNLKLFQKYQAVAQSPEFEGYNAARKRVINNALRDFRLGGAELAESAKPRFADIQERQAALGQKFSENVLDATNEFALYVDDVNALAGLPADALAAARARAEAEGKPGWKITLHMPSYLAVVQYADDRALREKIYQAYCTRASDVGPAERDNSALIVETLQLRAEEAHLLGYRNYAEVSLVPKMAKTPTEVIDFLIDLGQRARPYAERDLTELREFAARQLGIANLQVWDMAYASEKLREARYAFSEQEVKQYFPEPKVLEGLFKVVETLFRVLIKPDSAPLWHRDARFFRVESANGQLLAQFYLDLYARPGKRGGAWMDDARGRRRLTDGGLQTPIALLTCNFSEPLKGADGQMRPALFTHDEVTTLFHEFGHGLHHMLTQVEEMPVSGINGVEWDAVELPSQFMENFCWEWDVLKHMTSQIDSGAPLPRALFDKMLAAKNFQAGLQTLRQIELGLFDMRLHHDPASYQADTVMKLLAGVRKQYALLSVPAYNRLPHQFSHIFAGGYAAGYYSYKWAEVLSADAYARFEEDGVLNAETGARFRDEILGMGGSRPAIESFQAFRHRTPTIDALLRHNGMSGT